MLNLKHINELRVSAMQSARLFDHDLLNSDYPLGLPDVVDRFWIAAKIHRQAETLNTCLTSIFNKVKDFAEENFDEHIDRHNKWSFGDKAFDPYEELKLSLNDTDQIYSLPDCIERYAELLWFSRSNSVRKDAHEQALRSCFPDLDWWLSTESVDGNKEIVAESQIPPGLKETIDANRSIINVELDHCLDGYNTWLAKIAKMVDEQRPFCEMLHLFKA